MKEGYYSVKIENKSTIALFNGKEWIVDGVVCNVKELKIIKML